MQNVNLYQPETPGRQGPSRRQMLLGLALLGGLLLAHGLWEGWHGVTTARALEQAERLARQAEAELQARQAGFREPQLDPRLVEQLNELEAGNQRLQRLAEHLLALENRHREGFAPLLGGLADRHVPGLWLTRIRLEEGGEHIRLDGLVQEQSLLPHYLASLGGSPALQGRQFAQLQVRREGSGLLRFRLASRIEDREQADD